MYLACEGKGGKGRLPGRVGVPLSIVGASQSVPIERPPIRSVSVLRALAYERERDVSEEEQANAEV